MKKLTELIIVTTGLLFLSAFQTPSALNVIRDEAVLDFPNGITFYIELDPSDDPADVNLRYHASGRSCQASIAKQPIDLEVGDSVTGKWEWEWIRSGILPPYAEVWWYWEITTTDGEIITTEENHMVIVDQRNDWNDIEGEGIAVHWYVGDQKFGQDLHGIVVEGLKRNVDVFGIQPTGIIHIIVYPTSADVRDALLVATEWTGGIALPTHDSSIMGIAPDELAWAASIIPHELNHLVVGMYMFNCRGARMVTWLSEGLAEVAERETTPENLTKVVAKLENDTLPTLKSLGQGFSGYGDEARISYLQSGFVVQYLLDTYGKDMLLGLLDGIKSGKLIDDALESTYGFDVNGLDAEWRKSLGYEFVYIEVNDQNETATPTPVPTVALVNPLAGLATVTPTPTSTDLPPTNTPLPTPTSTSTEAPSETPTATATTVPIELPPASPTIEQAQPNPDTQQSNMTWLWWVGGVGILGIAGVSLAMFRKKN